MIHVRVYRLLDHLVVEASCVHGEGDEGSHLLLRERHRAEAQDGIEPLECLALSAELLRQQAVTQAVEMTDECGW